jgi:3'(2'), 5'-bisphosphate nucleotidase
MLELARGLCSLARQAGGAIMAIYATDFDARVKPDHSPVTDADETAERIILEGLARLAPEIPVVAEESAAAGRLPANLGTRFWLVDPLDGTREFLARNGEFTVNIALIEHGAPTLGVVYAPAIDALYWSDGSAAYRANTRIGVRRPAPDGLVVLASRSHRTAETDAFIATLRVKRFVEAGSSLKFCLLAAGEGDIYPRHGPTMEWDTAAGDAVLRAAGGTVTTLDGVPLRYGKPGFRNPAFVAKGLIH